MAVQSQGARLGSPLPAVVLPDLDGKPVDLEEYRDGHPLVVAFVCNHCPYVRHVEQMLGEVAAQAAASGVRFAAIVSNDLQRYPDDDIDGARDQAARAGWDFPYLLDAAQTAAKAFGAACTPDFFVFDAGGRLAYRGAFDESSPKNGNALTGDLLRDAIAKTVAGEPVPEPHRPALGCGIKWLPGNEPETISFV
jgi:thiol-disulfide isomerase/thioredoxin